MQQFAWKDRTKHCNKEVENVQFPKKFMRKQELVNMGFPEAMLDRAYRERGQGFARKVDPLKTNSPIVFDTDGLGNWWKKQAVT